MRITIDIPSEQLTQLDEWADSERISRAEAVRRALAQFIDRVAQPKTDALLGFGLWAQSNVLNPHPPSPLICPS